MKNTSCPFEKKCGGCNYTGVEYSKQLEKKQQNMVSLLGKFGKVQPIIGMDDPFYYRNKVHHVFARDRKGNILTGCYEEATHRVVDIENCLIEDKKSQAIIKTIKSLLRSFKITVYDEDRDFGLLRHVLVRRGFSTGEIMVVLVLTSPILPSKNNFVKALRKEHPEITTVVLNVNEKQTSMVLGERNITLYGPGFIKDELCGCKFKISPASFYQVNPVQTEKLYNTAINLAEIKGRETIIDAYCGIGTIGIIAASKMARKENSTNKVIGVELNPDAVKDARINARENKITNIEFIQGDAGKFMTNLASKGEKVDIVLMDPPRSGSTTEFIDAVATLSPKKVVYVSCGPDTLARDLQYFEKKGYKVMKIQPVDMFPFTSHVENVCLLFKHN